MKFLQGYTVYDEMLEKEDLDAVAIVTNVQTHKELIIKACDAKLHIFCEKPLSLVPDECKEIEKKVERKQYQDLYPCIYAAV